MMLPMAEMVGWLRKGVGELIRQAAQLGRSRLGHVRIQSGATLSRQRRHRLRQNRWKMGYQHKDLSGNEDERDPPTIEQWLFNESPRHLRVLGADKLPEVVEALVAKATDMAKRITEKADEVQAVTAAMNTRHSTKSHLLRLARWTS
jgi:hypothetical protein